ncbi:MAG: transferase [Pseudomonadota bacterium]
MILGSTNRNPKDIGFWALVREDMRTQDLGFWSSGFAALFAHRFGNWRMSVPRLARRPMTWLYMLLYRHARLTHGIDLPYTVEVGRRVKIDHSGGMVLVAHSIGDGCTIRQNTTFGIRTVSDLQGRPAIGSGVDIGCGAAILGPITIGDGAIIGANSVVTKDIPPGAVAGGVPAKVIRVVENVNT